MIQFFRQLVREHGQRGGEVLVFDEDAFGNIEKGEGEVPDGEDAAVHHLVANGLGLLGGHGDDADFHAGALDETGHFLHGEHVFVADLQSVQVGVLVEPDDDVQAHARKLLVGQNQSTEASHADQDGFINFIIT